MNVHAWAGGTATSAAAAAAPAAAAAAAAPAAAAAAAAPAAAADASPKAAVAAEEELPGALKSRNKEIPRAPNGIMNYVHSWSNRALLKQEKINALCREMKHMVPKEMKMIVDELKKEHDIKTTTGQFTSLFADAHTPVICWEQNGGKIQALLDVTVGDMIEKNLKKTINASKLGTLNKYVAMLRNYIMIEINEKIRHACAAARRTCPCACNHGS
jgi:pyruvate/2-oxoglutarate dehydrogenase complex dihydrolipoamide acyltransferase (E2) component